MKAPRTPLYLAREIYRRRRVMDAARLLPFIGIFLFAMPILWGPEDAPGVTTAREGLYLFVVWAGLIIAAGVLSRSLSEGLSDGGDIDEPVEGRPLSSAPPAGAPGAGQTAERGAEGAGQPPRARP